MDTDPLLVEAFRHARRLSTLLEQAYTNCKLNSVEPEADRVYLDGVIDAHRVTLHKLYDFFHEEGELAKAFDATEEALDTPVQVG